MPQSRLRGGSWLAWLFGALLSSNLTNANTEDITAIKSAHCDWLAKGSTSATGNPDNTRLLHIWEQARTAAVPALGLLIYRDGALVSGAACGKNVSRATPMRFGSITKSFTALTVLRMQMAGLLNLAQPVRSLLTKPPFDNPWEQRAPVRVGALLELSAGLPDLSAPEWDSAQPLTLSAAMALNPANRRLRWPAGMQHSYSNSVPGITQALIEQLDGTSLQQSMHKRVFKPLQMQGATLLPVTDLPGGFKADGVTPIPYWHMTFPAFGAMNANLKDMHNAMRWMITQGQLWSAEQRPGIAHGANNALQFGPAERSAWLQARATAGARAGLQIGYGAGIYGRVRAGTVFIGHGGDADGYRSRYGFDAQTGNGYLIVINTDNPSLLRRLVAQLENALAVARTPPAIAMQRNPERFTGRYYPSNARFGLARWESGVAPEIEIALSDNTLILQRGQRSQRLLPVAGTPNDNGALYRRKTDPVATMVFTEVELPGSQEPTMLLQGEIGNYVRVAPTTCPPIFPFCDSQ